MNTLRESCHSITNLIHVSSELARKLYFYVQWTGHFVCKEDFYIKRGNFDSILLLYTISGSGTLIYGGKKYALSVGTLMMIDCAEPHEYYPDNDRWEFKYVHFNGVQARELYSHIVSVQATHAIIGVSDAEGFLDRILDLVRNSGAEEICSEHIYSLLMRLIATAVPTNTETPESFRIKDALYYIAENYRKDISVSHLAELAHLSRCHFSTEFRKHTGFSPYNYILNYRISAAKRFLLTTDRTVEDIAERCGFSDASTFIRAFKRMTGLSPALYRNR